MLRLPPISGGGGRRRCRRRRRRSPGRWSRRPGPQGRERAKNLLWAAGKLADYGLGLGLEPVPEVLLHPSTAERFTRCAPGVSGAARRTLRTNLRFIGRRVVPHLYPADLPLPRERAKQPYSAAEIAGFLALADAQPTAERRMRAAGLVCLGAGAGLIRGDLRDVRGTDVACRSGGVIVAGQRAAAAHGAGAGPLPRPAAGRRRVRRGRPGLRRRRARPPEPHRTAWSRPWTAGAGCRGWTPPGCARPGWPTAGELLGLATFMHAAGISCSQRLGDLVAGLEPGGEAEAVRLLGAARP